MTSDGISAEDWDRVHELALEIVNSDDDEQEGESRRQLFAYLDDLTRKYGELPSICATRADYVDQPSESERLLLQAFDLAIGRSDAPNTSSRALSLASLYARGLPDVIAAERWLEIARAHLNAKDESDMWEYNQIRDAIEALRNRREEV
jgi:hypothetical protein